MERGSERASVLTMECRTAAHRAGLALTLVSLVFSSL